MAKFLAKYSTSPNPPPDVIAGMKQKLESGQPDEFGVKGINVLVAKDVTYFYGEAPSAEAILKAHEKAGVKLGSDDVSEVQSLV
jgi:hypothetical protein